MALPSLQSLTLTLKNLSIAPVFVSQVRGMGKKYKRRHTVPPFWLPKTTRTTYPENLTLQNETFLDDVVEEKFSSPLKTDCWERGTWKMYSMRCGLIGRKIGLYPMWKKDGRKILTTLLQVSDNHVVKYIEPENLIEYRLKRRRHRKLGALIVGADPIDPRLITKEYYNLFSENGIMPKKKMTKFLVTPNAKLPPGTPLYASHFRPGNYVDVAGTTIDRGFQGVVKRWGFKGMPASHGVTKSHRRAGHIGCGGDRSTVLPGRKMPGHMGRERRILRGLKIWRINTKYNVIWVHGPAVPGGTGSYVYIYDSLLPYNRHTQEDCAPFPTSFQDEEEIEEELYDEDLHLFHEPSVQFAEE